tara:strand:- start:4 stop:111 length:108 start_codon:yes stop_codon:yes gene_type:complete
MGFIQTPYLETANSDGGYLEGALNSSEQAVSTLIS